MKTALKLIAAFAVLAGLGGSGAVAQGGRQEALTYFYDDENHMNLVGGTLSYCDGTHTHWGSYSLYTDTYYYGCD